MQPDPRQSLEGWLTLQQASDKWGASPSTISRWIDQEWLPAAIVSRDRRGHKSYRVPPLVPHAVIERMLDPAGKKHVPRGLVRRMLERGAVAPPEPKPQPQPLPEPTPLREELPYRDRVLAEMEAQHRHLANIETHLEGLVAMLRVWLNTECPPPDAAPEPPGLALFTTDRR